MFEILKFNCIYMFICIILLHVLLLTNQNIYTVHMYFEMEVCNTEMKTLITF